MTADHSDVSKKTRPNVFTRVILFIRQVIAELGKSVAPNRHQLWVWSLSVVIFVVLLMIFVTALDFGLGKLVLLVFG